MLVVTFTNAAASEMKERVLDAIYKKLEEEPENEKLQKQVTLLNMASICTIDSFCLEVVKNNFYELENVSPNFRIADTPEIELLKQEVLDELFENKYLSEDKDFTKLINTYTSYRDDTPLKDLVTNIYSYISSSPYPRKWLNKRIEMFNIEKQLDKDFSQTPWGKVLLEEMEEELIDDIAILNDVLETLQYDKELEDFKQTIETDINQLNILKENLNNWDKSYEISQNIKFTTWPRKKVESEIKEEAKNIRDSVKKKFNNRIDKIFVSDSKQSNQDIYDMYDILKKLESLIIEFDEIYSKRKRDKNIVDFTDIEHLALNILVKEVEEDGEQIIKTEVAKKYTEKFEEIAIDGDVKQSIYRFRQAMPKLFLDKYQKFANVQENVQEGRFFLDKNVHRGHIYTNTRRTVPFGQKCPKRNVPLGQKEEKFNYSKYIRFYQFSVQKYNELYLRRSRI